jgi:hypothetical protein
MPRQSHDGGARDHGSEELVGFYADPVDEDGNVIAHVEWMEVRASWLPDPIRMVKVPHDEIVLDPGSTIHAKLDDEHEPVVPPGLVHHDSCPMGCGRTTEDPYGGPCSQCWKAV